MPLPDSYLEYPRRRRGNDHDRFDFSPLPSRPPVTWPGGKPVALLVAVPFEFYPLDAPPPTVRLPGTFLHTPPHYMQHTTTDYGHRVGIFRLFDALDAHGMKATALFNSEAARRYPRVIEEVLSRGWEVAASGVHGCRPITGDMPIEEERALIAQSVETLRAITGQPVTGWFSPAYSQSLNTFDLLAEAGIDYVMDWINDDMPYPVRTATRAIHALPLNNEWADFNIVAGQRQLTEEVYRQGIAAYRTMRRDAEACGGGRILPLPLHPAVSGQPFRIGTVEKLLAEIAEGGCWSATGGEILAAFQRQNGGA